MSTENLDAVDLAGAVEGGLINEDVMDRIYAIDAESRPFCDAIPSDEADNTYKEFVSEILEDASSENAFVDGQSLASLNDTKIGLRFGNYCQEMVKVVRVSNRGRAVDSIGTSDQMLWQLQRRLKALKRDEESAHTSANGAQAGDGNEANADTTGPSVSAGLGSWLSTNVDRGTNGANAVLSGTTGGYPQTNGGVDPSSRAEWLGITPGNKRGLTEAMVKSMMRACYDQGGNPSLMISVPAVIEGFSDYLFTSSARVASLQTNVSQSNRTDNSSGDGVSGGGVVAQGSVNLYVSNFGTLELAPDRFQKTYTAADTGDVANVFLVDPEWFSRAYLQGYQTKDLARNGLGDNSYVDVDVTLCAMAEHSSACIADITPDTAVVP